MHVELNDDITLIIFQYLAVRDILACQLVCRRFNRIIQSSLTLQFAIYGFIEFRNPRTDITLQEKCDALKLHHSRRKNHTITSVNTFKIGVANGGFRSGNLPSVGSYAPPLKDSVLAEWSLVHPDSDTYLQLDVVQLPSLNAGTDFKQWRLEQKDLNIRGSDIEPACDLLVLLEYTGPFIDPFSRTFDFENYRPIQERELRGLGEGEPQPYLFHFRTLSTNEPHPSAFRPTLDCKLRTDNAWGFPLECFGDLIIARPSRNFHTEWECGLIIYNWVTGALLDQRDATYQRDFVVLTNEVMVIPRSTFAYNSQDKPMGRLDLYRLDWSNPSNPNLSFVAILELPVVHAVPPPPPPSPNTIYMTTNSEGRMVEQAPPPPDLSRAAIVCTCVFKSSSHSGHPSAYTHGLPRIFTCAKSSQWLRVDLALPGSTSEFGIESFGGQSTPKSTSVYVPLHVILDALQAARDSPSVKRMGWDSWGPQARWIHLQPGFWEGNLRRAPAGTRCILTWHDAPKDIDAVGYMFDANIKHELNVWLLDFDPEFTKEVARKTNGDRPEGENVFGGESGPWVYQPAANNHMSPVVPHVDERRSWLAECGADKAMAPYAWCKFKHEYFDNVLAQIQNWKVYMDDEHIVVFEGEPRTQDTVKIVSFTF